MKALGGEMQGRFIYKDDEQKKRLIKMGVKDVDRVYYQDELAPGKDILFVATGVTGGDVLKGVHNDESSLYTHSMILNATQQSIHYVENIHRLK
jgi:fructose-1,6-bisphosphatase/sedoheptulose 1,7-bisphosphatase-like protein